MRLKTAVLCCISLTIIICSCSRKNGDVYLGQKPPGRTPEVLAPGIVSTDDFEFCTGFLKKGTVFIFKRQKRIDRDFYSAPTCLTELKNGKWTEPEILPFNDYYPFNFTTAPDNKSLYFTSKCSNIIKDNSLHATIWTVSLTENGWNKPVKLDYPVNTEYSDSYPSLTRDGTLYFMSTREGGYGSTDIYRSELEEGKYLNVENLGRPVNTEDRELDPAVAPDESYIIFCAEKDEGFGSHDLYITFRKSDNSWTVPANMGVGINTPESENRANITSDGKYIIFMRGTIEKANIYWVDAGIIEEMKPKELK
ncbi:TolB family protein [candidate division KSB1 bacterium]